MGTTTSSLWSAGAGSAISSSTTSVISISSSYDIFCNLSRHINTFLPGHHKVAEGPLPKLYIMKTRENIEDREKKGLYYSIEITDTLNPTLQRSNTIRLLRDF